ncbi:MAG: SRPBCC domain-containing protein [Ignavibacteria bacterium]|nr:SRPBCC domain-containing protein [Ignavibacteria bacterium]
MNKINSSEGELKGKEFVISRQFNAPQELVWKAFTESERLVHRWRPKGFLMVNIKLELRPGGIFHYCMKSPNGLEMWGKFVYHEIVPIEKIVFVNSFSDAGVNLTRYPLSTLWPLEVHNTLTLTDENGKTTLTLKGKPINATEEERRTFEAGFTSMQQGFKGTFDQLDIYLSKGKE